MMSHNEEFLRVMRFVVVGFSNFVIISLTVWIMMHLCQADMLPANITAYAIALVNNFVWNKQGGLRARPGNRQRQIALTLRAYGPADLRQLGCSFALADLLGMNEYVAQFIGLFVFGATNFIMNKLLTFKTQS